MFKSVLNVKVRVLWRDWLICEIKRATLEYKNTEGGEEEKSCNFQFFTWDLGGC